MRIRYFFSEVLGAKLRHWRWSWGAVDENRRVVFLRVWRDDITQDNKWVKISRLDGPEPSRGGKERRQHIELIRSGFAAYGVECVAKDKDAKPRAIASFDDAKLMKLGRLEVRNTPQGRIQLVQIKGRMNVDGAANLGTPRRLLHEDLEAVETRRNLTVTQKKALVNARIGQGLFRAQVLSNWSGRCALTGCASSAVIRASHIKPWRDSTDTERLDPNNGLPLVASLDALFDAYLISFEDDGTLLVSKRLARADRTILIPKGMHLLKRPVKATLVYLQEHRRHFLAKPFGDSAIACRVGGTR